MHAVERKKCKRLRAFCIAIAIDQAIRRPHLRIVALVAVAQVPGRFQPGLRVVRVEHGKRLTRHIILEFALPGHDSIVVLERCVNKGLSERQVRGLLHGDRKITCRQIGQNLRRQDRRGNCGIGGIKFQTGLDTLYLQRPVSVEKKIFKNALTFALLRLGNRGKRPEQRHRTPGSTGGYILHETYLSLCLP